MNSPESQILDITSPSDHPSYTARATTLVRQSAVPALLWPGGAVGAAALYLIGPCLSPRGLILAPILLTGALLLAGSPGVALLWTMAACFGVAASWSMTALFCGIGLAYTVLSTSAFSLAMADDRD